MGEYLKVGSIALVAAFIGGILAVAVVGGNNQPSTNVGGYTEGYWDSADGYYVDGTAVIDGSGNVDAPITSNSVTIGASGTTLSQVLKGTCTIYAYATTISASSTANVDCQSGSSSLSAITGITSSDLVFVQMPTTTPTTSNGLLFTASASTTAGYIHIKVINNTGGTFTWTAAASSSIPYIVIR